MKYLYFSNSQSRHKIDILIRSNSFLIVVCHVNNVLERIDGCINILIGTVIRELQDLETQKTILILITLESR